LNKTWILSKYDLDHISSTWFNASMNRRKTGDIAIESPTRRRLLVSTGLAAIPLTALAADGDVISRSAESIHQERLFRASRNRLYDALTDARQFAKIVQLSGAMQSMPAGTTAAEINREVGGSFSIFGGHIVGMQLELVPNQRIVQAWRVVDWKPGDYSIAKFDLSEQSEQTKVVFDHKGFPQGAAAHLAAGWEEHYWEPLSKFLASN
jgi:activator of HSP90 ATPase